MREQKEELGLEALTKHIRGTYAEHYQTKNGNETIDTIVKMYGTDFIKANIFKYLARYGKKDGNNPKDLLKLMHYGILLYYYDHKPKGETKVDVKVDITEDDGFILAPMNTIMTEPPYYAGWYDKVVETRKEVK